MVPYLQQELQFINFGDVLFDECLFGHLLVHLWPVADISGSVHTSKDKRNEKEKRGSVKPESIVECAQSLLCAPTGG